MQIEQDAIVKGNVLKERCRQNERLKLWSNELYNMYNPEVELSLDDIDDNKYYLFSREKNRIEVYEIVFLDTVEEFREWL